MKSYKSKGSGSERGFRDTSDSSRSIEKLLHDPGLPGTMAASIVRRHREESKGRIRKYGFMAAALVAVMLTGGIYTSYFLWGGNFTASTTAALQGAIPEYGIDTTPYEMQQETGEILWDSIDETVDLALADRW